MRWPCLVTDRIPFTVTPANDSWQHPCLRCGACCAFYRTSFYWAEADDVTDGGVPVELTRQLTPHLRVMCGTDQARPRCVALEGTIGEQVFCRIHPQRSSTCRDYAASYESGEANPRCDAARAAYGLAALTPQDWQQQPEDDDTPRPQPPRWPRVA